MKYQYSKMYLFFWAVFAVWVSVLNIPFCGDIAKACTAVVGFITLFFGWRILFPIADNRLSLVVLLSALFTVLAIDKFLNQL